MTSQTIWIAVGLYAYLLITKMALAGFACLSNPCIYGICMDDLNSTYSCYCIDGYTGIQCQTNWNECWSSPCINGGTCIDGIASYNCSCPEGFIGNNCEINYNECDSNPCFNNGTCLDGDNGYSCQCLPGYSGLYCEIDIAVCNITGEERCENGGLCLEGPGYKFFCKCKPGWSGTLCEYQINECESSPCKNGGVCIDLIADYSCACHFGYTGQNCEESILMCDNNPCENDALCLVENEQIVCYCVPDYHGDRCQYQYDECQLGPRCMNGGSCIDGIDTFTCSCPPDLTGVLCECLIQPNNTYDCTYIRPTSFYPPSSTSLPSTQISTNITLIIPSSSSELPTEQITTIVPKSSTISSSTSYFTEVISTEQQTTEPALTTIEETSETTSLYSTTNEITSIKSFSTEIISRFFTEITTIFQDLSSTKVSPTTGSNITSQFSDIDEVTTDGFTVDLWKTTSHLFTEEPIFDRTTTIKYESSTEEGIEGRYFPTESTTSLSGNETIPPNCLKSSCQNGGTCVITSEGPRCVCKFDTEGHQCEIVLGIQNAAFSGDSYLSHPVDSKSSIQVEIHAKTLSSNGLIFYSNLGKNAYMTLYVLNGLLKFQFSCGLQTMVLSEMEMVVNNGYEMKILAHLEYAKNYSHCNATVKLNDTLSMSGDQSALYNVFDKTNSWLHFGGIPQAYLHIQAPQMAGFTGCIHSLLVDGNKRNIFKDAKDGFEISECDSLACLSSPCFNGATCVEHSNEKWSCLCKNGYVGMMCERSVCENNPCLFGASCIPYTGGFLCLCPFGKHGQICEQDLEISEPSFSSSIQGHSSFAAYAISKSVSYHLEVKFHFVPNTLDQIALLMFIGQEGVHNPTSDHMAVSFVKGYIMLTWNLGSGPRRIFTTKPINFLPHKQHTIRLGRIGRRAWMVVDNMVNITGRSPGKLTQLDVEPILYLGGHDTGNFSTLPHDLPLHSGFSGCIFDVDIMAGQISFPLYNKRAIYGRSVGQCQTSECPEHVCQNGGACIQHGPTFTCLCADGWFGQYCTVKYNPCDTIRNNCSLGSTCVPLIDNYECDCSTGQTGQFCEKHENLSDVSFSGKRSYLKVRNVETHDLLFNIEMQIRPLNDHGLVAYIGDRDTSSFISMYLQGGILEFKVYLVDTNLHHSNGELILVRSRKVLRVGTWHRVRAGKYGKRIYLWVDEKAVSTVTKNNKLFTLNLANSLHLGGVNDFSNLPHDSTPSFPIPFTGCIRQVYVNHKYIPLNVTSVHESRNIADCDGTPCGADICLNGGTCWLDSNVNPHCSCLEQFVGDKCEQILNCLEYPCKNRGHCEKQLNNNDEVQYKCVCPLGWTGDYCEQTVSPLKNPQFLGSGSYIMIVKSPEALTLIEESNQLMNKNRYYESLDFLDISFVHINFTTIQSDGMLMWSDKGNEFFGVGVEHGMLKLAWAWHNTDTYIIEVPAIGVIADGIWHNLTVFYEMNANMTLFVDGALVHSQSNENELFDNGNIETQLATNGVFYVGGFPNNVSMFEKTKGLFMHNFQGCIQEIKFSKNDFITDFSKYQGENIGKCENLIYSS